MNTEYYDECVSLIESCIRLHVQTQLRDIMEADDAEAREISDKCALQFRKIMQRRR